VGNEKQEEVRKPEEPPAGARSPAPEGERGQDAFPREVSFITHVLTFAASASMFMGDVPNPVTEKKEQDLAGARHSIDTLAMLKEKTQGNLDPQETAALDDLLYSLRMRFVEVSAQAKKEGKEETSE
jgi:hypothetical protein